MRQALGHLDLTECFERLRLRASEECNLRSDDRFARHGGNGHIGGSLAPHGNGSGLRSIHGIGLQDAPEIGWPGTIRTVGAAFVVVRVPAERLDVEGLQPEGEGIIPNHADDFSHRLSDARRIRAPYGQIGAARRGDFDEFEGDVAGFRNHPDLGRKTRLAESKRQPMGCGIPRRALRSVQGSAGPEAQERCGLVFGQIIHPVGPARKRQE